MDFYQEVCFVSGVYNASVLLLILIRFLKEVSAVFFVKSEFFLFIIDIYLQRLFFFFFEDLLMSGGIS